MATNKVTYSEVLDKFKSDLETLSILYSKFELKKDTDDKDDLFDLFHLEFRVGMVLEDFKNFLIKP